MLRHPRVLVALERRSQVKAKREPMEPIDLLAKFQRCASPCHRRSQDMESDLVSSPLWDRVGNEPQRVASVVGASSASSQPLLGSAIDASSESDSSESRAPLVESAISASIESSVPPVESVVDASNESIEPLVESAIEPDIESNEPMLPATILAPQDWPPVQCSCCSRSI